MQPLVVLRKPGHGSLLADNRETCESYWTTLPLNESHPATRYWPVKADASRESSDLFWPIHRFIRMFCIYKSISREDFAAL